MSAPADILAAREALVGWLLDRAFPLWWDPGADLAAGGFHDRLDAAGRPMAGPQRARVQARQVFAYRHAGELGWSGPWRAAMTHGLAALEHHFRRPDGLYRSVRGQDAADLYDQAFVILAHAQVEGEARALALLERLPRGGAGGFAEFDGDELLANPNMHLFEAALAWVEAGGEGPWREMAADQARLAATRLIDAETGAISEVFGPGWIGPEAPAERRVEPGHQFEWAWLLMRWSLASGDAAALGAALRLIEIAERCGVDPVRNVAINALDGDLEPVDAGTRLWPQTERLRAHLLAGALTDDLACWRLAVKAAEGVWKFLEPTGLWRDSLESGDAAPASSLYHIVGAAWQLDQTARGVL
ncbi:MAG TPA: AGE family epimerase/isomerase [Caulobacteraceae bacterium]|nr:AGE family epimerase/isomerase [Caulobacteraceae bacterium]